MKRKKVLAQLIPELNRLDGIQNMVYSLEKKIGDLATAYHIHTQQLYRRITELENMSERRHKDEAS